MFPLGVFLVSSHLLMMVADPLPNINFRQTCRAAGVALGTPAQTDIDACLTDEMAARDQIKTQWAQFPGAAKQQCLRASTQYLPSYVEILTCLEMTKEAAQLPNESTLRPSSDLSGEPTPHHRKRHHRSVKQRR